MAGRAHDEPNLKNKKHRQIETSNQTKPERGYDESGAKATRNKPKLIETNIRFTPGVGIGPDPYGNGQTKNQKARSLEKALGAKNYFVCCLSNAYFIDRPHPKHC